MTRPLPPFPIAAYLFAAVAVAAAAGLTSALLPQLGLASAALIYLLPVLFTATYGRIGPALFAALTGAAAYNFFLLPPRYTFLIHAPQNLVSVLVLIAVAIVTTRLATQLRAREREALAGAEVNRLQAELAALVSGVEPATAERRALNWLKHRFGEVRLIDRNGLEPTDADYSALDLSAAAWAMHNADMTGHATEIMAASDWTFLPVSPRVDGNSSLLAVARPTDGSTRRPEQLAQLHDHATLVGQVMDRLALETERQARERLEQTDRLRQSLLAALAHDFRTPLTVITGQLEALTRHSPDVERPVREALAAAHRLDRTMDDLMGIARLEQGAIVPKMGTVDLVDVVTNAIDMVQVPESLSLERAVPAELPFVAADPVLLGHIIANLLDNAVRHARASVAVSAAMRGDAVELSVTDDGPGVPEADREHVFERFFRIEGGDRQDGSGLGLAIVRGFAEAMGATVSLSAAPSGGACFSLTLATSDLAKLQLPDWATDAAT